MFNPAGELANCSDGGPFCRLMNRTPPTPASGAMALRGIERSRSPGFEALPAHTRPTFKPDPNRSRHVATLAGSGTRYGIGAGTVSKVVLKISGRSNNAACR